MAIPLVYNMRSVRRRWASSLVAVLGIAGTVAVFVAMLALARGFKATIVSSGLPQNAIVQQAGSDSEMTSAIQLDDVRVVEDLPQVVRQGDDALVSAEVVVIAALPLRGTDSDANVQMRGVSQRVLQVRDNVRIVQGRFLRQGLYEIVVGHERRQVVSGTRSWRDRPHRTGHAGPSSASWTPAAARSTPRSGPTPTCSTATTPGPAGVFQSVTARLRSVDALPGLREGRQGRPAPRDAGLARTGVLRQPVDAGHARSSRCWAAWSPP